MNHIPDKKQQGIALITVLLVLSLATVAAVSMTSRQQLDIRRTTNILLIEEAYATLLAVEDFAKRGLIEDAKQSNTDAFNDFWASEEIQKQAIPVGNFTLTEFYVEDLQGRFNLTNLMDANGTSVDANHQRNFQRLLNEVGLPASLVNASIDWMDENADPTGNDGAESDMYSSLEKPYRTPNTLMASASELFRLNGVNLTGLQDSNNTNREHRQKICMMLLGDELVCGISSVPDPVTQQVASLEKNLLISLPERTPINVNTVASPAIYMMLAKGLSRDAADEIHKEIQISIKDKAKFTAKDQFWKHARIKDLKIPESEQVEIGFTSNYFLFRAQAINKTNEDFVVYLNTIMKRSSTQGAATTVEVVSRSFSKAGEI